MARVQIEDLEQPPFTAEQLCWLSNNLSLNINKCSKTWDSDSDSWEAQLILNGVVISYSYFGGQYV